MRNRSKFTLLWAGLTALIADVALAQQQLQQYGSSALFRQQFLVAGKDPVILDEGEQRTFAMRMQEYLQGAICNVAEQEIVEEVVADEQEGEEEEVADEEEAADDEESFTLQVDFLCYLPGGPALAIQYVNFIAKQDVATALSDRGLPILEAYAPTEIEVTVENPPTFAPVAASLFEFAYFQQYFVLRSGATGFTPFQETMISSEMRTMAMDNVMPMLSETGSMNAACGVPHRGQQVTTTASRSVAIIEIQCSFSSDNVDVSKVPQALVTHVNSNLPALTSSLRQQGLLALNQAEPLQIIPAPTPAPSLMPVSATKPPTMVPTTLSPTMRQTTLSTTMLPTTLSPTMLSTTASPSTFAPSIPLAQVRTTPDSPPSMNTTAQFVQLFVMENRRNGELLNAAEQQRMSVLWAEYASEALSDTESSTTVCQMRSQQRQEMNVLRVEYECTFSWNTTDEMNAPDVFVAHMNENLLEFRNDMGNPLQIRQVLTVRNAASPTMAPTPVPISNRNVGRYKQGFLVQEGVIELGLRGDAEFAVFVENLVAEFGDRRVASGCILQDQTLQVNDANQTILYVDYSCTYSSVPVDVSTYPAGYTTYVNDNLDEFTKSVERRVNRGIVEALEVVEVPQVVGISESSMPTLSPGIRAASTPVPAETLTTPPKPTPSLSAATASTQKFSSARSVSPCLLVLISSALFIILS